MKTLFKCLEKAWWLKKKRSEWLVNNAKKLGTGLSYKTKKKKGDNMFQFIFVKFFVLVIKKRHWK